MLTAWSMTSQVNHQQPLNGNKSKEDRNLVVIGFLSFCFGYGEKFKSFTVLQMTFFIWTL